MSFGTDWRLSNRYQDDLSGLDLVNTTGIRPVSGGSVKRRWAEPGEVYIRLSVVSDLQHQEDLIGRSFHCSGLRKRDGKNILRLESAVVGHRPSDFYLLRVADWVHGTINELTTWRSHTDDVVVVSSSYHHMLSERLLLVSPKGQFITSAGTWSVRMLSGNGSLYREER